MSRIEVAQYCREKGRVSVLNGRLGKPYQRTDRDTLGEVRDLGSNTWKYSAGQAQLVRGLCGKAIGRL